MHKNKSSVIILSEKIKNSTYNELNLIGLKTRFCLRDKPEECKQICIDNCIKFNRTYSSNIFSKLRNAKNTLKDFDHIIVPRYLNRISLKDIILKEKKRMLNVNRLSLIINSKITDNDNKKIKKPIELSVNNRMKGDKKMIIDIKKSQNESSVDLYKKVLKKKDVKHKNLYNTICCNIYKRKLSLNLNKLMPIKNKSNSSQINTGNAYFDKNNYIITSKGGVMKTSSLWRSKNMNNILLSPTKKMTESLSFNYETNMIKSNAFTSNIKVRNFFSFNNESSKGS